MKKMFFSLAFFACAISMATAQKNNLRFGGYFDMYPAGGFPVELGVTSVYQRSKWFRLGMDMGLLNIAFCVPGLIGFCKSFIQ
jgi:hypothetical protein